MSWEIEYRNKWNGEKSVHPHSHNRSNAEGWAKSLSEDNDCKATCYEIDEDGNRKHIVSYGSD